MKNWVYNKLIYRFLNKNLQYNCCGLITIILLLFSVSAFSQILEGYNVFKYPNGNISSEGLIKNGRPEGYWKNYYKDGNLKSEGNRNNFQLDSLWKFYDNDGLISVTVEYLNGLKNGFRTTFNKDSSVFKTELFKADTIHLFKQFFKSGDLKIKIQFKSGEKYNYAFEYNINGLEQTWWNYKNGNYVKFIVNRKDEVGKRTGKWVKFDNEILREEVNYIKGFKNGIEKIYNEYGKLILVNKYNNGLLLKDFKELKKINFKKTLGSNGLISESGGYNEKKQPHGVHRKYDEKGNVQSSKIYKNGIIIGSGIVKKNGKKDGKWNLYYDSGKKRAEGKFINGIKIGYWKYFYKNGLLENEGNYALNGKQDGLWKEYFNHGGICEEINYFQGLYDGIFIAYNDTGKVIIKGHYKEDYEIGEWIYINGNFTSTGYFINGNKNGEWISYYKNKQIIFKGSFQNGIPIGEHLYWYETGVLMKYGIFKNGRKYGIWMNYASNGRVLMVSEYLDGLEIVINGFKFFPRHDAEDYIEFEETGYQ